MIIKNLSDVINNKLTEDNDLHNKKDDDRPITIGMYNRYRRFKLLCKLIKVILTTDRKN